MKYNQKFSEKGINNYFGRLNKINQVLIKELQPKKDDIILDIGCNKGDLVKLLQQKCTSFGIDINKEAINSSNVKNLKIMDAKNTNFPDDYFTKIVSSHTIEHIPNLQALFKETDRILKTNGIVILAYPFELWKGMGTMRNAWIFYKNPFMGHKIHINWLNHNKIKNLIKKTSLKIKKKTIFYDPMPTYLTILIKT